MTPIFKKGRKQDPGNYRPVSLTCVLCKVMEKLIRQSVVEHLEQNKLISDEQHGFVRGRSCITHLLDVLDDWTTALEEGYSIDAIYMDFRKAFDSVPHCRLMSKLEALGIRGQVLPGIRGRSQRVLVNGNASSPAPVTSGIPQGSVLGPTLFVMYINDMPRAVNNRVKMFTDDTKLYARSDTRELTESIQRDLTSLQKWSDDWLLVFHPQKCSTMKLGRTKSEGTYFMINPEDNTVTKLPESSLAKDLGVLVDDQLTFKEHIATATAKANRVLGVIRRSF